MISRSDPPSETGLKKYPRITIHGQPPSKSNERGIRDGKYFVPKVVKDYTQSFMLQCRLRGANISRRFRLALDVFYRSDRPDLDNALKGTLDALQSCGAIKNDRLCIEIHARKFIDKEDPRIEFEIEEI